MDEEGGTEDEVISLGLQRLLIGNETGHRLLTRGQ